ncbi:aromatic-L-amino-acid decarboxylase like protein [Zymoseptoria brevis]|uniref:Aromatic-L-amino-acid decarboxylase like protein n=1 Tax=Zymoseptoria brevis TaxID=1047168 RepID=A0A0F4GJX2_9PEZI|nr:aromatic-L-amino-acid decarboxylase like protein [Zymoseptoria brevis]
MEPSSSTNGDAKSGTEQLDQRVVPPLGMTGQQFQRAATSVINDIEQYYSTLADRKVVSEVAPGYLQKLLPTSPPKQGESWQDIEKDIERTIMPGITHWQSPKFMAFFAASSTYPGILGEMWSAALTAPAFNWICSPAVTELETIVMDWMAQTLALPDGFHSKGTGGGVIQGSASEAIVTVVVAARERYVRRQIEREGLTDPEAIEDRSAELRSKLVCLASDQTHSSTQKASNIAGTRFRSIPTRHQDAYALKGRDLRQKIEELKAKGLHPCYLTASIGATPTCAVDDFESIAEVARDYPDIWIHCDAAWSGAALILPEYQHLSRQMSFVDSFNFNMHKWLLTNFDASCLFVQKRRDLTDTLSITPAYLKNDFTDGGLVTDYRDWQIPLGRRFRALKMWFVIRTWGVQGLQEHIRHHIRLGHLFAELVVSRRDLFSVLAPPDFALTVLTVNPSMWRNLQLSRTSSGGGDPRPDHGTDKPVEPQADDPILKAANDVTKEVFTLIDQRKEFFLTSTVVGGVYAIRVVSANPLAEEKYVRQVFEDLVDATEEVLAKHLS